MNKRSTEPETLASFLDTPEREVIVVDRSDLELVAECPWKLHARKSGLVVPQNFAMASGTEAHDAISRTIADYVTTPGGMQKGEVREQLWGWATHSRPDLQPDVCTALRASLWSIAELIASLNPANIQAFDGGEGERSSQFAKDFDLGDQLIRVTSELDLLLRTASPEKLIEYDWKTGWDRWDCDRVADAFQFQLHAVLLLEHFPDVQTVEIRIWNTRTNDVTHRVDFPRTKLDRYTARVREAAEIYAQHHASENPPAWPLQEKCERCEAKRICPAVAKAAPSLIDVQAEFDKRLLKRLENDPEACVDRMHALQSELAAWQDAAKKHVKATGAELVGTGGRRFGTEKPRQQRTTYDLYAEKENDECKST